MEKLQMPLQMNEKIVTTNELVRTVICSVLEDLENNFDSYAALYTKDFEEYTPDEKEKIYGETYTLIETIAPDGYSISEQIKFEVGKSYKDTLRFRIYTT